MDLISIIEQAQGGRNVHALGQQFGLSDAQTRAAIEQLAPVIMAGVRRNTQSADGLSGLIQALAQGNHGRYLDGDEPGMRDDGKAILGHVFGSKDVSRGVVNQAADLTGIGSNILKQMLPAIAAMVMGALAKNMMGGKSGGGLGDILGQVLGGGGGGRQASSSGDGGLGDILGQVLGGQAGRQGGGGLGDILGQVLGGGQQSRTGQGDGGLGDILGQVLGGGSTQGGGAAPGGAGIDDILKNIFGDQAAPEVREQVTRRGGDVFGDVLGRGTERGNAADDLLNSVERAVRRR